MCVSTYMSFTRKWVKFGLKPNPDSCTLPHYFCFNVEFIDAVIDVINDSQKGTDHVRTFPIRSSPLIWQSSRVHFLQNHKDTWTTAWLRFGYIGHWTQSVRLTGPTWGGKNARFHVASLVKDLSILVSEHKRCHWCVALEKRNHNLWRFRLNFFLRTEHTSHPNKKLGN